MLKRPRRIILLVKAGSAVQAMIDSIVPYLEAGDIIIDGGNSEYHDSNVIIFLVIKFFAWFLFSILGKNIFVF